MCGRRWERGPFAESRGRACKGGLHLHPEPARGAGRGRKGKQRLSFPVVTGAVLGQGAGTEELLERFDAVRAEQEKMEPAEFNDDSIYKAGINRVGGCHWVGGWVGGWVVVAAVVGVSACGSVMSGSVGCAEVRRTCTGLAACPGVAWGQHQAVAWTRKLAWAERREGGGCRWVARWVARRRFIGNAPLQPRPFPACARTLITGLEASHHEDSGDSSA